MASFASSVALPSVGISRCELMAMDTVGLYALQVNLGPHGSSPAPGIPGVLGMVSQVQVS